MASRSLHSQMTEMVLAETCGTTGDPCRRVYLPKEFHTAFVAPWLHGWSRRYFKEFHMVGHSFGSFVGLSALTSCRL
ncbi:MAG TPA: hypothetical protein EYH36_09395 [Desulfocapsa sulfexigens]|nr:hypothetical protein [Desulfocapsa sulfexigens]